MAKTVQRRPARFLFSRNRFSRKQLALVLIPLLAIGVYLLYRTFAATAPAGTYSDWHYPQQSDSSGLNSMQYNLRVDDVTTDAPYFWSYSVYFTGHATDASELSAYIGLQSHGSCCNGGTGKTAVFSLFGTGATGQSPSCKTEQSNFDGGAYKFGGSSCIIHYDWVIGHTYQLKIFAVSQDSNVITWRGTVSDTTSNQSTDIGTISSPLAWGKFRSDYSTSWTEYFGGPLQTCDQLPHSKAFFSDFKANGSIPADSHNNHITQTDCAGLSHETDANGGVEQEMGKQAVISPPIPPSIPPPPQLPGLPTINMKINGQTGTVDVQPNQAFTLSWATSLDPYSGDCSFTGLSHVGDGAFASPGSFQQTLASGSTTYKLSCNIAGVSTPAIGQVTAKVVTVTPPPPPVLKVGDVNGDGVVNQADLDIMSAHWQQNYPPADFDKNGVVDAYDLSQLLVKWDK